MDIENKGKKNIRVHEDHDGNIYLTGVASKTITTAEECMRLLEEGAFSRSTASTQMNATSSRSHAIFTVFVKHHRLAPVSVFEIIQNCFICSYCFMLSLFLRNDYNLQIYTGLLSTKDCIDSHFLTLYNPTTVLILC